MGVPSECKAGVAEILTYKPYFENVKDDEICRKYTEELAEDGTMPVTSLLYRNPILGFIEDAYVANILEPKYIDIMNNEMNGEIELEVIIYGLEQASYQLTMAVLTCIIRQEQYCQGLWEIATKEKWFLKILERLEVLMKE